MIQNSTLLLARLRWSSLLPLFIGILFTIVLGACKGGDSNDASVNVESEQASSPITSPLPDTTPKQDNCDAPTMNASGNDGQGNIADYAFDQNTATYWAAETIGSYGTWLQLDCGKPTDIIAVDIDFFQGDTRISYFVIQGSSDSEQWRDLTLELASSGNTDTVQRFPLEEPATVRYLRYVALGTSASKWNAVSELTPVVIDKQTSPSPTPEITPAPIANAATPSYPNILSSGATGDVTMYNTTPSSGGACNYGATNVEYYAAINVHSLPGDYKGEWRGGAICGQCVKITTYTSQGPKTAVVRIMDKCPDVYCGIDTGGVIPSLLMPDGFGRYNGEWAYVSCEGHPEVSDGEPVLQVLTGSNIWWSRVHVRNGSAAVTRITWQTDNTSGELPFAQDPENTFEVPTDLLQSNISALRLTIQYSDNNVASITLKASDLGVPGSYPLDP